MGRPPPYKRALLEKDRALERVSLLDVSNRIKRLKSADLAKLSPAQLRNRIGRIIDDYPLQVRPLQSSGVYRARKNSPGGDFSHARELWYPPSALITRPSRLNGVGESRLYAASMPNTAILELKPEVGDLFTVLVARTKSRQLEALRVAFIGIERSLAPEIQSLTPDDIFRTSSRFHERLGSSGYKKWLLIDDYLSSILGESIDDSDSNKYKLTAALGNLVFESPDISAITYPSVATHDHGINICFLPERADALLEPSEAWVIRIEGRGEHPEVTGAMHQISFIKRSEEIGSDGIIKWLPPGVGLGGEEISRFVRRRMTALVTRPRPLL
jgi:RES domain